MSANLYKQLGNKIFVGGGLRYTNYASVKTEDVNQFSELNDAKNIGVAASIFQDQRNNLLNATTGHYAAVNIVHNFSSTNYTKVQLDLRKYFSFKNKIVLSTRLYNSAILGTPNFYDYSIMGGDEFVRGYFYGRFRDKNLSTLQTEIRSPYLWRFGLAAIGGISTLYDNF